MIPQPLKASASDAKNKKMKIYKVLKYYLTYIFTLLVMLHPEIIRQPADNLEFRNHICHLNYISKGAK